MSRRSPTRRRGRALLGLLAAMLAMLGVVITPAAAAPEDDNTSAKIEQAVKNALAAKDDADFWIMFREKADLSAASEIKDWATRGAAVVDALRRTADASQAEVRAQLNAEHASYKSFHIVNAIKVTGGSTALAESLAKRANVTGILAPRQYEVPKPTPGVAQARIQALEWGLAAINADDAWGEFGSRGEGITVASVDTGVDYLHPALVGKYRGNTGNGTFDHNYNWFDPAEVCDTPAPCDPNSHGTHTMGTMVGDDGAGNQIGVAPNARWITAAGCCPSDEALADSGEWMLEPRDLNGENPRADLRPHIVNNSWGSSNVALPTDPFYKGVVQAWRASGIFPAFANGNIRAPIPPATCDTSGSPGDYVESYSVGAFDINGAMAGFSSRGPGETGTGIIKPNLSAPGVNVRSSVPGGGYDEFNGTSMASPHMVGTVALMLSAAPALIGEVATIESILDGSAIDTEDLSCGGTAADNNVWGEGKLDARAAVAASPRGATGTLSGTITNAGNGDPIAGAKVHLAGPLNRDLVTGTDGRYSVVLSVGDYTGTATAFGFASATGQATVVEGQTATLNLALSAVDRGTVTGRVRDARGVAVANAKVEVLDTPITPVTTAADGSYTIPDVPHGTYQSKASSTGGCFDTQTQALNVTGNVTLDFALPNRRDRFGNFCVPEAEAYVEGDTPVALTGDDAATTIPLPFDVFFYGTNYSTAHISSNGHINFLAPSTVLDNVPLPATAPPNAAIYAMWDDLLLDAESRVMTRLSGVSPNREFVVEWRNARFFNVAPTVRVDFEAVLSERGEVSLRYRNLDPAQARETGVSATVGIENATGTDARQFSHNSPVLSNGQSIRFKLPPNGLVSGKVTDFNDGQPVAGATIRALRGDTEVRRTTSNPDGTYGLWLLAGEYTIELGKQHYVAKTASATTGDDTVSTVDAVLHTPRAEIQGTPPSFLAQAGQLRSSTLTLRSTSELDLTYTLSASKPWLWTVPGALTVPAGGSQVLTVRVDPVGLAPGVHTATIDLTTNAGRTPTIAVPVTLVVPAYRKGVDAGANGGFNDANADTWVADQAWSSGGFGYLGPGFVETTRRSIAGTDDDTLFQSQRSGMAGYRFDNLPAGTYQVELDFAELRGIAPGRRVFDVSLNGNVVLPGYDPAAAVGVLTADRKVFTMTVSQGGTIEVSFGSRKGKLPPILNSIRVTHRPDL